MIWRELGDVSWCHVARGGGVAIVAQQPDPDLRLHGDTSATVTVVVHGRRSAQMRVRLLDVEYWGELCCNVVRRETEKALETRAATALSSKNRNTRRAMAKRIAAEAVKLRVVHGGRP